MYNVLALQAQPARKKTRNYSIPKINFVLSGLVIFLAVVYLVAISSLSTKGYEIKQLEQKIKALETQHKHLEVQTSNLQSINRIKQEADKLNFVPVGQPTFMPDSDYALK